MNLDNNLLQLFTLFLTAGGLGFVNYFILARLDKINITKNNKEDKPLFLILFSLLNYTIYLLVLFLVEDLLQVNNQYLGMFLAILFTLGVTVILTFTLLSKIASITQEQINKKRGTIGKSSYDSLTVKQRVFDYNKSRIIYIFDLDNNLIDCGFSGWFSSMEGEDFELSLYPFNKENTLLTYQDVMEHINKNEKESDLYMNIDKKVKIIIIH